MRLKQVYISDYKNLQEFSIDFSGDNFVDVFVGKNGTGKSNLLEGLLEIFRHLLEDDYDIKFSYKIKYELNGSDVYIHWDWSNNLWKNETGSEISKVVKSKLPETVLLYYSGHNPRKQELINTYEIKHEKLLNDNRTNEDLLSNYVRKFAKIDGKYKSILIAVLLLQDESNKARQFIMDKLLIDSLGDELRIDFQRPNYAKRTKKEIEDGKDKFPFEVVNENITNRFWGSQGYFKHLLEQLWEVDKFDSQKVREEGLFDDRDIYIMYCSLESFKTNFNSYSPLELFIAFDNLKVVGYLKDIRLDITLTNGKTVNIDQLSDGQFQTVYIYALTELYKDKNCITLLDEPDSFLHPEWQYQFLSNIDAISEESARTNHVLMSTHSAVTLVGDKSKKVNLFRDIDNNVKSHNVKKDFAVNQLSSALLKVNFDKQLLSIIHTVSQGRSLFLTEGYSDPIIIKEAWGRLFDDDMPFDVYFGFGCEYLRKILCDSKFQSEMSGLPIFGMFDFDEAYNHWNSLKSEETQLEENPFKGLCKKVENKNSYAFLIPIPQNEEIKKLVIKNEETLETFKNYSRVELEHLFYCEETKHHFSVKPGVGGAELISIGDSVKIDFATNVVPSLPDEYFEVFRPMFEFVKSKI